MMPLQRSENCNKFSYYEREIDISFLLYEL